MTFGSNLPRPLAAMHLFILASLFCIVSSAVAFAAEPLVISVSSAPVNLPIFVADTEGYFSAEGVAVKINEATSSVQAMELLFAGKTDLTAGSETLVIDVYKRQTPTYPCVRRSLNYLKARFHPKSAKPTGAPACLCGSYWCVVSFGWI